MIVSILNGVFIEQFSLLTVDRFTMLNHFIKVKWNIQKIQFAHMFVFIAIVYFPTMFIDWFHAWNFSALLQ